MFAPGPCCVRVCCLRNFGGNHSKNTIDKQWPRFPGMWHTAITNVHLLDLSDTNEMSDKFWRAEYGLEGRDATLESNWHASLHCELNRIAHLNPFASGLGEAIDCIVKHPWTPLASSLSGVITFEEFSFKLEIESK